MSNEKLNAIKDQVARECHLKNWDNLVEVAKNGNMVNLAFDVYEEVVRRYAASQEPVLSEPDGYVSEQLKQSYSLKEVEGYLPNLDLRAFYFSPPPTNELVEAATEIRDSLNGNRPIIQNSDLHKALVKALSKYNTKP